MKNVDSNNLDKLKLKVNLNFIIEYDVYRSTHDNRTPEQILEFYLSCARSDPMQFIDSPNADLSVSGDIYNEEFFIEQE